MTLSVPITPEIEAKLRERAACAGKAPEELAQAVTHPALDELLSPLRREVEATYLREDDLSDVLERAKHDMRRVQLQL